MRTAKNVRRFDSEDAFWSWLTVLARSAARDAGRKQSRYGGMLARFVERFRPDHPSSPAIPDSEPLLNALLNRALLNRALLSLPAEERALLESKYFEGLSVRDIAGKSRLLRCRWKLRLEIDKRLKEP